MSPRELALTQAVIWASGRSSDSVVQAAQKFYDFLNPDKDAQDTGEPSLRVGDRVVTRPGLRPKGVSNRVGVVTASDRPAYQVEFSNEGRFWFLVDELEVLE